MEFKQALELAKENQPVHLLPVIEKELLHYAILFFMQKEGYFEKLTFQGGTSLRLCYGSDRFSEDLDFASGNNYDFNEFKDLAENLQKFVEKDLKLEATVKEPKLKLNKNDGVIVDKWQVSVWTTPELRNIPKQKIKIEFANISAYKKHFKNIKINYLGLEQFQNIIIPVEKTTEILADKILAFVMSKYIRYRDIWDMAWLLQNRAIIDKKLIEDKLLDYSILKDDYLNKIEERSNSIQAIIDSKEFSNTMQRFLPLEKMELLSNPDFKDFLVSNTKELLEEVRMELTSKKQFKFKI